MEILNKLNDNFDGIDFFVELKVLYFPKIEDFTEN